MLKKKRRRTHIVKEKIKVEGSDFFPYLTRYYEYMRQHNYSASTLRRRDGGLRHFIAWCDDRSVNEPQAVSKPILDRYCALLVNYRKANGQPLSAGTRAQYVIAIKQWFKWLAQENYIIYNPASDLIIPKSQPSLPYVLSVDEVKRVLSLPANTGTGLRDKAILTTFYSTGVRRNELRNLNLADINLGRQTLFVRQGKGGKDRMLPLGEKATELISAYLTHVRPHLVIDPNDSTLFLNDYGEQFRDTKLGDKVKKYLRLAGIEAPGACHLLRHAMATHMLDNGADLRYIQTILGHSDLNTTQVYTHVSIRKLQSVHAATLLLGDDDPTL